METTRRKLLTLLSSIPALGVLGAWTKSEAALEPFHGWKTPLSTDLWFDENAKEVSVTEAAIYFFTDHYDPEDGKIVVLEYSHNRWEKLKRDPDKVYGNYVGSARSIIDGKEHQKEVMEVWCPTESCIEKLPEWRSISEAPNNGRHILVKLRKRCCTEEEREYHLINSDIWETPPMHETRKHVTVYANKKGQWRRTDNAHLIPDDWIEGWQHLTSVAYDDEGGSGPYVAIYNGKYDT